MKIDPAVVRIFAKNVRAEIIQRPAGLTLDSAIVQKISARLKVFKDMNTECLLSTLARVHKAADIAFVEDDIGSSFHIVVSSEVVVEKNKNGQLVTLAKLDAGECFGEMALVGYHPRCVSLRALRDSVTIRFDRERVDAYPDSAHVIYRNIARVLSARLDEPSETLPDLVVRNGATGHMPLG